MMPKKIVFISGVFNIIHPGHIRLIKYAKSLNCKIYVGVLSDKILGNRSQLNEKLRLDQAKLINLIDKCFLMEENIKYYLNLYKPKYVLKGKEHENNYNIEKKNN